MENKKMKILYAEDEKNLYNLLERILKNSHGLEMKHASDYRSALSMIEKENFDIYISDGLYGEWKNFYEKLMGTKPDANSKFILYSGDLDILRGAESYNIKCFSKLDVNPFEFACYIKKILK